MLCRVLDTVEDHEFSSPEAKIEQFDKFEAFISSMPKESDVQNWISQFPLGISEDYQILVNDSFLLFEGLHKGMGETERSICQSHIIQMKQGMKHYALNSVSGGLRLSNIVDVNRYCYFVAGLVGDLIRALYCTYKGRFDSDAEFKKSSIHFGLFLQKVNLLKDQSQDESESRFLVPDRAELQKSMASNARGAWKFLAQLPVEETGFRLFCAWSLFLGLATVKLMPAGQTSVGTKIPKVLALALIGKIEALIKDNKALKELFDSYFPKNLLTPSESSSIHTSDRFWDAMSSQFSSQEIQEFGF